MMYVFTGKNSFKTRMYVLTDKHWNKIELFFLQHRQAIRPIQNYYHNMVAIPQRSKTIARGLSCERRELVTIIMIQGRGDDATTSGDDWILSLTYLKNDPEDAQQTSKRPGDEDQKKKPDDSEERVASHG